jgi:hypothetical protein
LRFILRALAFAAFTVTLDPFAFASGGFEVRGCKKQGDPGKENTLCSVYSPNLDFQAMAVYARSYPWAGPGSQTVLYFFDDWKNTPDVAFTGEDFNEYYKQHWVAGYWHRADGTEMFIRYPAEKRKIQFT